MHSTLLNMYQITEETSIIDNLNTIIDNNNIPYFNQNDLRPSLKSNHIPTAVNLIQEFIDNPNLLIRFYGESSSGMTNHIIYRRNGQIYNAFYSMAHGIYCVSRTGPDFINNLFPYFQDF